MGLLRLGFLSRRRSGRRGTNLRLAFIGSGASNGSVLMAFSIHGIGTTYYGQRDYGEDGSFLTTEWVTVIMVPLIPIRSLRVRYRGSTMHGSVQMDHLHILARSRPHPKQVACIYAYMAFLVGWTYAAVTVMGNFSSDQLTNRTGTVLSMAALAVPIPIPWLLRRRAYRKAFGT